MRKMLLLSLILGLWIMGGLVSAQDDGSTSTINYFFVACETQAVFDFDGTMDPGYDIYVQVFREAGASGKQLTNLTRVSVNNQYQVSQVLPYASGETMLFGQFASARIMMARETDPSNSIFSTTVDDISDTCLEPSFSRADTTDLGSAGSSVTTPLIDPVTGNVISSNSGASATGASTGIFKPGGGELSGILATPVQTEAVVQIGARPSLRNDYAGRTGNPGLIFAECDAFPAADPGRIWDIDTITVFWSWFAKTPALAQQHIDTARYEVFLSSPYANRQTFPNVQVSPITQREDGNYWVFYTANLGNGFRPGQYRVDYYVTWTQALSDGYDDFGPGTANVGLLNTCTFDVEINPLGIDIKRNNPTVPLQQGS